MLSTVVLLPLSRATLDYLAGVVRRHRRRIGSCWRKLNPGKQALLVLAHLRIGETFAALAGLSCPAVSISQATVGGGWIVPPGGGVLWRIHRPACFLTSHVCAARHGVSVESPPSEVAPSVYQPIKPTIRPNPAARPI